MPKMVKKAFQKLCASARSEVSSPHSLEKAIARDLISFQLSGMGASGPPAAQSNTGTVSWRSAPRAVSRSGMTERTTSQKRVLWFISRRCASSWATT